jgi:hypothetical protein
MGWLDICWSHTTNKGDICLLMSTTGSQNKALVSEYRNAGISGVLKRKMVPCKSTSDFKYAGL